MFSSGCHRPAHAGHAFADYLILRTIRDSGGTAIAVDDDKMVEAMREVARLEGLFVCPEGAAAVAGFKLLAKQGYLRPEQRVVLFNTGSGLKYAEIMKSELDQANRVDSNVIDIV